MLLRDATRSAHERLHAHAGFAAVKDMTIDLAAYRTLLGRLYGFYVPFERIADIGRERSRWLAQDLQALRVGSKEVAIAICQRLPVLDSPARRLGAAYVIEGSALGGRELARGLDHLLVPLLGAGEVRGRRFFLGRGADTGAAWRDTLDHLAAIPPDPALRAAAVSGALDTFAAFDAWMTGWRGTSDA